MALIFVLLAALVCLSVGDQQIAQQDDTCRQGHGDSCNMWRDSPGRKEKDNHKPTFLGEEFFFKTRPVPRYHYTDSRVYEAIARQEPVVMTGKWLFRTDVPFTFDYLRSRLTDSPTPWTVVQSSTRVFNDTYPTNNFANYKMSGSFRRIAMNTSVLYRIYDELERADNGSRIYIQGPLDKELLHESVYRIDWRMLRDLQGRFSWSDEHTHLVLLAQRDSLTPTHYDYDENIFQQIFGYKRFILFHPDNYGNIYPHPVHHSRDRHTQADFDHPDFEKFPKLKNLEGIEAVLGPGDLLYVPSLWWHLVEASREGPSFSIAFRHFPKRLAYYNSFVHPWDSAAPPRKDGAVVYHGDVARYTDPYTGHTFSVSKPDNAVDRIHIRRQVEHMLAASTGSYRKVKEVLHEILDGRFNHPEFSKEEP